MNLKIAAEKKTPREITFTAIDENVMLGLIDIWNDELNYIRPSIERYKKAKVGEKVNVDPEQLFRATVYACSALKDVEKGIKMKGETPTPGGKAEEYKQLDKVIEELKGKRDVIEHGATFRGASLYQTKLSNPKKSVVECMIALGISPDMAKDN